MKTGKYGDMIIVLVILTCLPAGRYDAEPTKEKMR